MNLYHGHVLFLYIFLQKGKNTKGHKGPLEDEKREHLFFQCYKNKQN